MDQTLINPHRRSRPAGGQPAADPGQLHGLFPEDEPAPEGSVEQALQQLREACADRGVELVEVASGYRYQVKADVHGWVARLWTERKTKYTRATLETLALIAYRQPITRGEIEQVRGVAVSSNIIQALEEREWIRVVGHRDVPGKPALFGTTKAFLDYFGLKRLDELPPLSELKDIGELEPQLPLDGAPLPVSIASGDAVDGEQEGTRTTVADDDGDAMCRHGRRRTPRQRGIGRLPKTRPSKPGDDAGDTETSPQDDDAAEKTGPVGAETMSNTPKKPPLGKLS
jgi:segregation and condensation protein B